MGKSLTDLLNIQYPIIQGGMGWISDARLVSAVCNAGGTGVLAGAGHDGESIRAEIHKTKSLTDKPFGANIPLNFAKTSELVEAICRGKPAFVTLGAGNPIPYIEKFHHAGIMVFTVVPSAKLAKRVETAGVDAIIVEGMESGGHIGTLTTMALLTNVAPLIKNVPLIAAGGIVDGRGIAAALLMGADGVQMGSRFLLTNECAVHPNCKQMIINAVDTDIVVTGYSRGSATRCLKNNFTDQYLKLEIAGAPKEELDRLATGTSRLAHREGDIVNGAVQVGQSILPLDAILPVSAVLEKLIAETRAVLASAKDILF